MNAMKTTLVVQIRDYLNVLFGEGHKIDFIVLNGF